MSTLKAELNLHPRVDILYNFLNKAFMFQWSGTVEKWDVGRGTDAEQCLALGVMLAAAVAHRHSASGSVSHFCEAA